jgi:hypothetical protein
MRILARHDPDAARRGLLSLVRRPPPNAYTRMVSVFACAVVAAYLFYAPFDGGGTAVSDPGCPLS